MQVTASQGGRRARSGAAVCVTAVISWIIVVMSSAPAAPQPRYSSPRGPYRTGRKRRKEILDVAVPVFAEFGYAGTTMKMIADKVGLTTPGLMRHFGGKDILFAAVLEHSDIANAATNLEGLRGLAYLRQVAAVVAHNVHNRGLVELLLTVSTESSSPDHPAHEFIATRYETMIRGLVDEFRYAAEMGEIRSFDDAELEVEARGMVALLDGLQLQWLINPDADVVAISDTLFTHLFARWAPEA